VNTSVSGQKWNLRILHVGINSKFFFHRVFVFKKAQGGRWHSENEQKFGAAGSELQVISHKLKSQIMPDDGSTGMLDGVKSMYYAPAFRSALQRTMKECKVLPNPVQKNMQAEILNCFYRKKFGKKSEDESHETEEERTKRWSTVNDT
jgi:hypothetical protein